MSISKETELALATSYACPERENPVTSVAAWTSRSLAKSLAILFNLVIESTAASKDSLGASLPFFAVLITPTPKAFVSTSTSPSFAPLLDHTSLSFINDVTHSPYFGVGSDIVCPPAITAPAS